MALILRGITDQIRVRCTAHISLDLGKTEKVSFVVTYRKREGDDAFEVARKMGNDEYPDITDKSVLRDDVLNVEELTDVDGATVEFSSQVLEAMLSNLEYRRALNDGWSEAQLGTTTQALAKNS